MAKQVLWFSALAVLVSIGMQTARLRAASDGEPSVKISDVIICDNQRRTTEEIKSKLHTHIGDEYNPAKIEEDVRQLNEIHHMSIGATMKEADGPGRVKIYFVVREFGGKVQKVTFRGAKHMKEEDLRNLTDIQVGMPLDPYKNRVACDFVVDKYEKLGRPFSHCTLVKGGELSDTEVIFDITEGPKAKVRDIQFTGNTFVNSARLMKKMHSTSQGVACIGSRYNKQMADSDVNELIKFYRAYGYQDVRVSLETQPSADGCQVTLIFHIQEGLRYRIQDLPQDIGTKSIPAEHLETLLQTRSGDYLDPAKIDTDAKRIKDYFGYNGQDVRVEPIPVWSQYQIMEQPAARVGRIIVSGNKHISSESILAHVPLFPGQTLSYPDLRQAEKTLADLGLFVVNPAKGVHPTITVIDSGSDSAYKNILITVREKKAKQP